MNAVTDADLAKAVRATGWLRTGFYIVVLGIALTGQVTGAGEKLGVAAWAALPAVLALELGGVVFMANADIRRRLGESALSSRVISAGFALGAVGFNAFAHSDRIQAVFFAGMSLAGYAVYLINAGNKRRDRLRAEGQMEATAPVYGLWQWIRHPGITRRARILAVGNAEVRLTEGEHPTTAALGRLASLAAAREQVRAERREAGLARAVGERISKAAGKDMAKIAVATYDMAKIAKRLADKADYDGIADLIGADLTAQKLAGEAPADDITAVADAVAADLTEIEYAQVATRFRPPRWRGAVGYRPRRLAAKAGPIPVVVVAGPKIAKPDTATVPAVGSTPRRAPAKKPATAAARVAAEVAKKPDSRQVDVADRLKISLRTVERYWPKAGATAVNGSSGAR